MKQTLPLFPEDSSILTLLKRIRPGYVLVTLIVIGYIIGVLGDTVKLCNLDPSCQPTATYLLAQQNWIVYNHGYWQLFTSIFVTDSGLDVVFNAIAVLVLDYFLPETFNNTRYFSIFFSSAFLGNALTLVQGPYYASAGASGGIFGVFAAAFAYNWAENKRIDMSTLVLFIILFAGSSFLFSNVNWIAHLGGSMGGFIGGPLLYFLVKDNASSFDIASKSSVFSKVILLFIVAVVTVASVVQFLLFVK